MITSTSKQGCTRLTLGRSRLALATARYRAAALYSPRRSKPIYNTYGDAASLVTPTLQPQP